MLQRKCIIVTADCHGWTHSHDANRRCCNKITPNDISVKYVSSPAYREFIPLRVACEKLFISLHVKLNWLIYKQMVNILVTESKDVCEINKSMLNPYYYLPLKQLFLDHQAQQVQQSFVDYSSCYQQKLNHPSSYLYYPCYQVVYHLKNNCCCFLLLPHPMKTFDSNRSMTCCWEANYLQ